MPDTAEIVAAVLAAMGETEAPKEKKSKKAKKAETPDTVWIGLTLTENRAATLGVEPTSFGTGRDGDNGNVSGVITLGELAESLGADFEIETQKAVAYGKAGRRVKFDTGKSRKASQTEA